MQWSGTNSRPATKYNQILEALIVLADAHEKPDDLALARIRREALQLMSVDASSAHDLLGIVASLTFDVDEMRHRHELAVNLSRDRPQALINFAVSLSNLGFYEDAARRLQSATELEPENLTILDLLIDFCVYAGRLRDALRWLDVWKERAPHKENEWDSLVRNSMLPFAVRYDITDEDLAANLREATALVVRRRAYLAHWGAGIVGDDEDQWISYRLPIHCGAEEIADLSEQLAQRCAEMQQPASIAVRLAVRYEPACESSSNVSLTE